MFTPLDYPDLLVGLDKPDDAAVWRLDKTRALVVTTDFFTPVVDEPYDYGAIAATNSLSDVYAMGGKPFLALNVAAFPPSLPNEMLGEILRGGAEKAKEAGVVIAGGHTIQDKEPKYGLVVVGLVETDHLMTKAAAKVGDRLVLSKPLGFGVTTTAIKQNIATEEQVREVVTWMSILNKSASELGQKFSVHSATDITGFGLIGHAWEMAQASGVGFRLKWEKIPFTSAAFDFACNFIFPGGAYDNLTFFKAHANFIIALPQEQQLLLFDPQTSGGLLMSVPDQHLDNLVNEAQEIGQFICEIGEVIEGDSIEIV